METHKPLNGHRTDEKPGDITQKENARNKNLDEAKVSYKSKKKQVARHHSERNLKTCISMGEKTSPERKAT